MQNITHIYYINKICAFIIFFETSCPLFISLFVMPFVSRKTWCGRMIHSCPSNILQSKIKTEGSGATTAYVVSQLRRICESISRFICLYLDSQAIFKPYLTAHISAIFRQCLCKLRNLLSIFHDCLLIHLHLLLYQGYF